jgi:hypothetical protein
MTRIVTALSLILLPFTIVAGALPSHATSPPPLIVGSWDVTITSLEWPGGPLPDWYRARATFGRSGGLVQTVTDPFITTGHGTWKKTALRTFAVTTFLSQFAPDGTFLGTIKANATIVVRPDGKRFKGEPYQFELFDADGKLVLTGSGVARGTRIKAEPID